MDEISLTSYTESLSASFLRNFAEWSRMPPEVWAEEVYRLPNGQRFRWDYAPYSRAMFRSVFDPKTIETVFELYSRGLKSTVILIAIGYIIDQAPRRILSLWPTNSQAEKWSKDNLCGELLDTTPSLNFLGSQTGRRISSNTLLHKLFPGGLIDIFGANAPGDMRRAKGSFLYGDEIDAIETTQTDEGDQLAIFNKRGDEYPDTIRVFASYPSILGYSRVHSKIEESDGNQWLSTCVLCGGEPFVMHRSLVVYEKERPETARMMCPRCKDYLNDAQRYEMAHKQGFDNWEPLREFRGKRGFQANAMLWPHPVDTAKFPGGFLQMVAQQEIDAQKSDNPKRSMRVLVNTVDAEPFDPTEENEQPPDYKPLMQRREPYNDGETLTVPARALVITAAVDVHKNRLEVEWEGWGRHEENWGLDHVVLPGEVQDDAVWKELERELCRKFQHESGGTLELSFCFVDAGKWPEWIYRFLRSLAQSNSPIRGKVRACRGSSQFPHPLVDQHFKSIAKNLKGHWIGTDACKDLIYTRCKLLPNEDGSLPTGYIHFPQSFDEVYFQQLTSERVTIEYDGGKEIRRYKNSDHLRNETLDLKVYNLGAFRLRRWAWDAIEADLKEAVESTKNPVPQKPRQMASTRERSSFWSL